MDRVASLNSGLRPPFSHSLRSFYDRVVNERGLRRTLDVEEAVGYEAGVTAFSLIMPLPDFSPQAGTPPMQQAFDSAKDAGDVPHDPKRRTRDFIPAKRT